MVENPPVSEETRVQSLVQEDPTCLGATRPVHRSYRSPTLEAVLWATGPCTVLLLQGGMQATSGETCSATQEEERKEGGLAAVVGTDTGKERKAELPRLRGRQPADSPSGYTQRRKGCDLVCGAEAKASLCQTNWEW